MIELTDLSHGLDYSLSWFWLILREIYCTYTNIPNSFLGWELSLSLSVSLSVCLSICLSLQNDVVERVLSLKISIDVTNLWVSVRAIKSPIV